MVAYSFKKQFVAPILAGTKPQTMRNERARHAKPGEEVQLYYGMRTKHCFLIGRAICTCVLPVRLDFRNMTVEIGGRNLISRRDKVDKFARADGFSNWKALEDFWDGEHRTDHGAPLNWTGVLIEWMGFKRDGDAST